MLFIPTFFLFFFLCVTITCFLLPYQFRWMWLLAASLFFYYLFIPAGILIIGLSTSLSYLAALGMERQSGIKRKMILAISIVASLIILFVFKPGNLFSFNESSLNSDGQSLLNMIILTLGLSVLTLQNIAYVIEVFMGDQKPEKNFGVYSLYILFYPKIIVGPFERPQNLIHQFYEAHDFNYQQATEGLKQMAWGFFKKLVIADRLAFYVNEVYNNPGVYAGFPVMLSTIFFAFQIYCDLSGYSDIAIGAARVMGFRLTKNFNNPYSATTITEFWKKWFVPLSWWVRDYLYDPVFKRCQSIIKTYLIVAAVFITIILLIGGSNTLIIWAVLHVLYLVIEKYFGIQEQQKTSIKKTARQILTFSLICFAWIFFRANTTGDAFILIESMFKLDIATPEIFLFNTSNTFFSLLLILILIITERAIGNHEFYDLLKNNPRWIRIIAYHLLITGILFFGIFNHSKFIPY